MVDADKQPSTRPLCDADQIRALLRAGDMAGLDRASRCYAERLLAIGRRACSSEDAAQDAVQDAFVAASANLDSFRGDGPAIGWLSRMVVNACHRMRRGRKNDPALHISFEDDAESAAGDPEQAAAQTLLGRSLEAALLELKPRDRTMVMLSEGAGWTAPELAKELGMTPGAVRTRLSRLRSSLRERLADVHAAAL